MFCVEAWVPKWRRWGNTWSCWWSVEHARLEAENKARLLDHPFRVVDEKGQEHGRWVGEEVEGC